MKIQYINNFSISINEKFIFEKHEFTSNNFDNPFSLDEFDINIIDLNSIWENSNSENIYDIDIMNDLKSLKDMMANSKKTIFLLIIPFNQQYRYTKHSIRGKYTSYEILKDIILQFSKIPEFLLGRNFNVGFLKYERTQTFITNEDLLYADFYFSGINEFLTKSNSDKITTIKLKDKIYITTLNFCFNSEFFAKNIINFLKKINLIEDQTIIPEWIYEINLLNDKEKKQEINNQIAIIKDAQIKIKDAQEILKKNLHFKSILYSTGDELVNVVFEILEKILDYNLSDFKDNNHEDFLIKKPDITFIGEIKGVNGSIKSANISQLEVHYRSYLDELEEEKIEEKVKALLIINPNKNRKLEEREKVHQDQINLATRNGSLIIQTYDLLKIFEAFEQKKLTTEKIEEIFINKIGLLEFEKDFE
ncbi:hypothetical protein [uncultured Fusobacterium sp.]|uniref:hypothetical protein n=1 Tax=uncultured Fusobacterium sp. TaxID=159267 RepID=UPI002598010B|nr:hypothetical protein [uncultured Fusobacterium sp.]